MMQLQYIVIVVCCWVDTLLDHLTSSVG